ncbi:MAG: amidohydrolase [Candidatus Bathyarchaeia archaeon]
MPGVKGALYADLVLLNGKVVTVDADFSVAEAVAVREGRVLAVGSTAEIETLAGEGTEVVDLEGRTVLPGLIDSHIHMVGTGLALSMIDCRTPPMRSIADIVAAVKERAEEAGPGEWIQGRGWDQAKLAEHRNTTRWDLDEAAPDNPVYLIRTCGHVAVVNSRALEIAGITRETPQPVGGTIVKDEAGEPMGLLLERPAFWQVLRHIPPPDLDRKVEAIKAASEAFSRVGLTGVIEAGIVAEDMRAYQRALREGGLTVRVNMMLRGKEGDESVEESLKRIEAFPLTTGYGDEMLRFLGLKLLIDGGIGGRTALLREPYEGEPDNRGILTLPEEDLQRLVDAANLQDMMVGVHCAGGRAMDIVLGAFERTDRKRPIKGRRFTLIHAYQPSEENFERCRRLGVVAASQPSFLYYLGDSFYENVGPERSRWVKPHRAWIDNGIVVAAGTDSPVTPYPPFPSLWAAIVRKTEVEAVQMGTEQRVTREEAIRMYTINGAYLTFEEEVKGSIDPGKLADLIVIDRDILTCPEDEIKDTKVLRTILGGKTVYKA